MIKRTIEKALILKIKILVIDLIVIYLSFLDQLLVNKIVIKKSYNQTSFYLVYRYKLILLIKVDIFTQKIVDQNIVYTIKDLFEARLRILKRREVDIKDIRVKIIVY